MAAADPPELDLLRLTADANASYKNIVAGAICILTGLRGFVEGANPPDTAALPPQSIQYPVQHSVTEATTGLLPQEVKRTNDLN